MRKAPAGDAEGGLAAAYAGLTLTAAFWAGNAVVARASVGDIPPLALSFWRWAVALLVVLPFGLRPLWRQRAMLRQHWPRLWVLAALSVGAFNTLLYLAAQSTSALNIALVNSNMPIGVAILAWLVLGQPLSRLRALGIGCALGGVLFIITRGEWRTLVELSFAPGDLLMVAAILCWGSFSVLMRRFALPLHALTFLTAQIALGLTVILPFYLLELALGGGFEPQPRVLAVIGYVAVFPGLLAYAFWNHGVARVGPARAAMFIYLVPVFAAVLAVVFLEERLYPFHTVGGGLILVGLWLATRPVPAPAGATGGAP